MLTMSIPILFSFSLQQHHQSQHQSVLDMVKTEFKTPEKMRYERAHVLSMEEQHNLNRQVIAENMNVAAHYASSSRPSSTSSASSGHYRQSLTTSSPSPNLPDYTQVSPAKMALRRHLSQEKISQQFAPMNIVGGGSGGGGSGSGTSSVPPGAGGVPNNDRSMASKTIGDLVNGEIERTLEISNQSIINAAINMSSMIGQNHTNTPPTTGAVINTSVQRPERVNVRVVDETMTNQHNPHNQQSFGQLPKGAYNRVSSRESPIHLHGQSNLATLAHVAYNQKTINPHGMSSQVVPPAHSHAQSMPVQATAVNPLTIAMNPLTIQTTSPRATHQFSPASAANLRYQSTQQSPHTPRSSASATVPRQSEHIASNVQQHTAQPKYMPLPRADMTPHLESYFAEQKHQSQLSQAKIVAVEEKRRGTVPLEGNAHSHFCCHLIPSHGIAQFSDSDFQVWQPLCKPAFKQPSTKITVIYTNGMTSKHIRPFEMVVSSSRKRRTSKLKVSDFSP